MAELLTYEGLKDMKLADYKKAFKNKAQWKKAKAVFFILDYKIEGKKVPVALPLKRPAELKQLFKTVKADKHPTKKIGGGSLKAIKGPEGMEFQVDLSLGGLVHETLEQKAGKLFKQLLKVDLISSIKEALDDVMDSDEDAQEEDNSHLDEPIDGAAEVERQEIDPKLDQQILATFKDLKSQLSSEVKEIVSRYKAKANKVEDEFKLIDLKEKIAHFNQNIQNASLELQNKMEAAKKKFESYLPQFGKMTDVLKNTEIVPQGKEEAAKALPYVKERLERILKEIEALEQEQQ
jgi:predicted nuclease with TOPRIM domain